MLDFFPVLLYTECMALGCSNSMRSLLLDCLPWTDLGLVSCPPNLIRLQTSTFKFTRSRKFLQGKCWLQSPSHLLSSAFIYFFFQARVFHSFLLTHGKFENSKKKKTTTKKKISPACVLSRRASLNTWSTLLLEAVVSV